MPFTGALDSWRRSVAVRLSLWFATLFTVGFCAIFALLYWTLERHMEERDVEGLKLTLQQYSALYSINGLAGLQQRVAQDSQIPHVRSLFVRIVGSSGNELWVTVPRDWIKSDVQRVIIPGGWTESSIIRSVKIPVDEQQDLVVVAQALPGGLMLQVGRSTDSRTVLLEPLRRTFIWVGGAVLVVGLGVGFLAARRATRPLQSVVETARKIIRTGSLDARVPVPRRDDEIAELVRHFNTVLDKNATLVRGMREALDNVAHDLRTPLTSLRGTAELALGQPADQTGAQEALADTVERADEVLSLLRAIMEISEAEAGMLHLDKSRCDLGDLARGPVELYTDVAESRGLQLSGEIQGAIPLFADATRLRQAIANLIDNAVKYTPAGGKVWVRAMAQGDGAILQVRDTGPGVSPEEQPRIWERLYRGDQSRSASGLGLGLSLVRAIVEAHGGRASVTNAAEGGAIFELWLPLASIPKPGPPLAIGSLS
jgi:signal transduction histidine kinase